MTRTEELALRTEYDRERVTLAGADSAWNEAIERSLVIVRGHLALWTKRENPNAKISLLIDQLRQVESKICALKRPDPAPDEAAVPCVPVPQMNADGLLPCPFCGGEAVVDTSIEDRPDLGYSATCVSDEPCAGAAFLDHEGSWVAVELTDAGRAALAAASKE